MKIAGLSIGLALAAPAYAQETRLPPTPRPDAAAGSTATGSGGTDAADLNTVVVTATRSPQPIDRIAASVTVLDKAEIDRDQDLGVSDLLLRTPGVSLSRNGGYGTATSLRIRGAETDQTVVVIDGVKLNDPAAAGGGYNFANLLVGDASRIEVLRGPQSILWGSQAIGGVVNIVTPLPERRLEGSVDVEAGSRDTVSARAAIGGKDGPLAWRIGGQTFTTDGISAIAPAFGGVEKDGYTNQSITGRAVLEIAPGISADLRGYYSSGDTDFDATTGDDNEYGLNKEFVGYAGLNVDLLGGRFRNRFGYAYTDTKRDNYNPDLPRTQTFDSGGRNRRFEYQGGFAIADGWDVVFGAEDERSRFHSVSPPASLATPVPAPATGEAGITSEYAQLNATVRKGLTLTGGVRHDEHSRFGSKTLFAGGGVWALPTGTVLRASYSEGFKAPTLYQLFSQYGNQALAPEQASGWEAGVEQRLFAGKASFGATYFERRSRDLINFASCPAASPLPLCFVPGSTSQRRSGYYLNVARAFAQGIEAAARVELARRLLLDGNYSWTLSEDRSTGAATFGKQLARRPRHAANGSVTYTLPAGPSLGVAVRWSGETFDNAANTIRLAPYALVDLRAELPLSTAVRLFARAENLFDKEYMTAYRYGALGRSVYAGFRGRF